MSVHKRKGSPYYYFDFVVKGRRFTGSTKTASRREAERVERETKEREKAAAAAADKQVGKSIYTLSEACGIFWTERGHRSRGKWQEDTARYLKQICQHVEPTTMMDALGDKHVNQFVQARLKNFEKGKGHAVINRALAVFRAVHNHAKDLHEQPVKPIKWSRHFQTEPKERIRWLTKEEMVTLLNLLPLHTQKAVAWSVYTGMRLSATYDLLWTDIDLQKGEATIVKKGGDAQTIVLSADAIALLETLSRDNGLYVFNGRNRRKIWERALEQAKIKDFRWHDLRHTHATWLRQAGAALEIVQRSLGHQSVQTTQRYAHVDDNEVRRALTAMPKLRTDTPSPSLDNVVQLKQGPDSVYFIQADDAVKIGRSKDPTARLASMQTGQHVKLKMLGWMEGGRTIERLMHEMFAAHHIHGEWFRLHEDITNYVEAKCDQPEEIHSNAPINEKYDG